jgi:hypothetical protein
MWMGVELVEMKQYGFGNEWDSQEIVAYLSDLVYAKDKWQPQLENQTHSNPHSTETWAGETRYRIREALRAGGVSILDVIDDLGLSHDDTMLVLFTKRRVMTFAELRQFEIEVVEQKHSSPVGLGKKFGMTYKSADSLADYWGVPYRDRRSPELKMIDELLGADPPLTNVQIAQMVNEQLGTKLRPAKIGNRRHFLANRKSS